MDIRLEHREELQRIKQETDLRETDHRSGGVWQRESRETIGRVPSKDTEKRCFLRDSGEGCSDIGERLKL